MFAVAFYKGTRPGVAGIYNRGVRWWDAGDFSHAELVFSDGMSASASFADGGVRFKAIEYDTERWELIELPAHLEPAARQWFAAHEFVRDRHGHPTDQRTPYDLLGNLGFIWRPIRGTEGAFFCSEAVAAALGFPDPWRYSPNLLYSALKQQTTTGLAPVFLRP